ncbi:MAG: helix-turn-helix domain-containing protein [Thermoplasmatales archaeon]|nr:helix-turn-helix domain-containing protein [Thermoplasmatales archaeon]
MLLKELLKKTRKDRGFTKSEAALAMHVSVTNIMTWENGELECIDHDIYAVHFLKKYTKYLDLDFTIVSQLYHQEMQECQRNNVKKEKDAFCFVISHKFVQRAAFLFCFLLVVGYLGLGLQRIISPPYVELYSPENNMIISDNAILVSGITDTEAKIIINDSEVFTNEEGYFTVSINLKDGVNVIKITSKKRYSKERIILRHIMKQDKNIVVLQ